MEDMILPFHMIRNQGIGDVIIPRNEHGSIILKNTDLTPPSSSKNALFRFENGGTGFLIAITNLIFNGVTENFGLLLTAAHVVVEVDSIKPKEKKYALICNKRFYSAYLIEEFISSNLAEYTSNVTNCKYCLPGDVSVLIVRLKNRKNLEAYERADTINLNGECFVSGFPIKPQSSAYALPSVNFTNPQELSSKVDEIFHGFSKKNPVFSSGEVVDCSNNLVEISCSTTNGMSGSPIIQNGKYIGVYVGGPALPGQRELMQIIHYIHKNDFESANSTIWSIQALNQYYMEEIFSCLLKYVEEDCFLKIACDEKKSLAINNTRQKILADYYSRPRKIEELMGEIKSCCYNLIYKSVIEYRDRENFRSNIGISYCNSLFNRIEALVGKFHSMTGITFSDIEKLVAEIKNC